MSNFTLRQVLLPLVTCFACLVLYANGLVHIVVVLVVPTLVNMATNRYMKADFEAVVNRDRKNSSPQGD